MSANPNRCTEDNCRNYFRELTAEGKMGESVAILVQQEHPNNYGMEIVDQWTKSKRKDPDFWIPYYNQYPYSVLYMILTDKTQPESTPDFLTLFGIGVATIIAGAIVSIFRR